MHDSCRSAASRCSERQRMFLLSWVVYSLFLLSHKGTVWKIYRSLSQKSGFLHKVSLRASHRFDEWVMFLHLKGPSRQCICEIPVNQHLLPKETPPAASLLCTGGTFVRAPESRLASAGTGVWLVTIWTGLGLASCFHLNALRLLSQVNLNHLRLFSYLFFFFFLMGNQRESSAVRWYKKKMSGKLPYPGFCSHQLKKLTHNLGR